RVRTSTAVPGAYSVTEVTIMLNPPARCAVPARGNTLFCPICAAAKHRGRSAAVRRRDPGRSRASRAAPRSGDESGVTIVISTRSGGDGDRTHYLLHAMQALYQLSYAPIGG